MHISMTCFNTHARINLLCKESNINNIVMRVNNILFWYFRNSEFVFLICTGKSYIRHSCSISAMFTVFWTPQSNILQSIAISIIIYEANIYNTGIFNHHYCPQSASYHKFTNCWRYSCLFNNIVDKLQVCALQNFPMTSWNTKGKALKKVVQINISSQDEIWPHQPRPTESSLYLITFNSGPAATGNGYILIILTPFHWSVLLNFDVTPKNIRLLCNKTYAPGRSMWGRISPKLTTIETFTDNYGIKH